MKIIIFILGSTILFLSAAIKKPICKNEKNEIEEKCFSEKIKAKVKLAQIVVLPSGCGINLWVEDYKFEFLDSAGIPFLPGKFIDIEFECPGDIFKSDFFQKDKIYNFLIEKKVNYVPSKIKPNQDSKTLPVYLYLGKY